MIWFKYRIITDIILYYIKYDKKSRASKIILYAGMNHANRVASLLEGNGYGSRVLKGENTADTIGISGFEVEIEDKLLEAL
jgi:hypothetical protein